MKESILCGKCRNVVKFDFSGDFKNNEHENMAGFIFNKLKMHSCKTNS